MLVDIKNYTVRFYRLHLSSLLTLFDVKPLTDVNSGSRFKKGATRALQGH